jgi:hypothetical protein
VSYWFEFADKYFQTPHPLYKPSNDFVPCKDPLCASLQPTDDYTCEDPNQCDYEIKYADQYSTLGVLLNDVYLLNFTNGVQLKVRMALGFVYFASYPLSFSYAPLKFVRDNYAMSFLVKVL